MGDNVTDVGYAGWIGNDTRRAAALYVAQQFAEDKSQLLEHLLALGLIHAEEGAFRSATDMQGVPWMPSIPATPGVTSV